MVAIPVEEPDGYLAPSPLALRAARRVGIPFVVNLALVLGFAWFSSRFQNPGGPSVLDLELSFTAGTFKQILLAWASEHPLGVHMFKLSVLLLDMAFPAAYAAFLSALYAWVVSTGGGHVFRAGIRAPWVAAGLDWIENILLLVLLLPVHNKDGIQVASFSPTLVSMMSAAAALKVAILVVPIVLTVIALFQGPRGRVLWLCRFSALSVALGSLPLLFLDQGRDLLLSLTESTAADLLTQGAFFVFLVVWALSVWYWARVLLMLRFPGDPPPTTDQAFFAAWTPRVLGTATVLLAGVALLRASAGAEPGSGTLWIMRAYGAACVILAVAFWLLVRHRRAILARLRVLLVEVTLRVDAIPKGTRLAAAASLLFSAFFFVLFTWAPVRGASKLGALAILLIAAANTVFFGSIAAYLSRWLRLPLVLFALVASAVMSGWNDNHDVRLASGDPGRIARRPALAEAFRAWYEPLQRACAGCSEVPVYLVAAEGGGIRAAYWTAGVLTHLQDRHPDFAGHVFTISGVSGGSLGAAVFAALVKDSAAAPLPCAGTLDGHPTIEPCAREILSRRFLAPVLAKLVAGDFAQRLLPLPVRAFDRASALEDSWANAYQDATGRSTFTEGYLDGWPGPESGVPALALNVAHVQSGRRALVTPFAWTDAEIPDTLDLHQVLGADLPLMTAVNNSARFAFVSPAGRLRAAGGENRGHVVDGGYFENSGIATLHDLLRALRTVPVPAGPPPRFVIVYLCNSPERCHLSGFDPAGEQSWRRVDNLAESLSPLRTLLRAREARGSLALAEIQHELGEEHFVELGVCRRLENKEHAAPLPLGWQLSKGVRAELDRQAQDPVCGAAITLD